MNFSFPTPELKGEYDVLVVGGGFAGVAAAVAAARTGVSVAILEKSCLLGGLGTIGLINWYEPLCDGKGKRIIGGISEELLYTSIKYCGDTLPDDWREKCESAPDSKRYTSFFSPTTCSLAMQELVIKEGITVRYDTLATYPQLDENGIIKGVLAETKTGCEYFSCKVIIDATGDADIAYRSGCETELGTNFMSYIIHGVNLTKENRDMCSVRRWLQCGASMTGNNQPEDIPLLNGVTSDDVNTLVQRGLLLALKKVKTYDRKSFEVTGLPVMPQFRTTRRLVGDYTLTEADRFCGFEDSIGAFGDFRGERRGDWYEIPYRALFSSSQPNLLCGGRIISATGEAWNATRVIPVAALTGEACGVAAALSVKAGVTVPQLDRTLLRYTLRERGNIVDWANK